MRLLLVVFLATLTCLPGCVPTSCTGSSVIKDVESKAQFRAPGGTTISVEIVRTEELKTLGLSGRKSETFSDLQAMLFWYDESGPRRFWMPDTYFDLDIFFLDHDWVVLDVDRNVPHYIGRSHPESIPTTRTVYAQYVLEMKATSEWSKKISPGTKLEWISEPKSAKPLGR